MNFKLSAIPVLAGALLLGACQVTTFEQAPIAAEACDATLAGTWLSVDEDPAKPPGEITLRLDGDCRLIADVLGKEAVRSSPPTPLSLGRRGAHRYAWVDARWALDVAEEDEPLPEGDLYLVRFAQAGDELTLWPTDAKPVAHAIIDGELKGEVVYRDSSLFNRLGATRNPAVLDHPGLFVAEPARFRRGPVAKP